MSHITLARRFVTAVGAASLLVLTGCTMKDQDPPALAGPSELGTALSITANPDIIAQDGASQSAITVIARDGSNQPVANLGLRADIVANGNWANDFGRLSAQNFATGSDGRATVVYTAPPRSPDNNDPESVLVQIYITPVGVNYDNTVSRFVSVRLVKPGTIYVPGTPVAQFSYTPPAPVKGQNVFFDGTYSADSDGSIVSYQWTYGDGDMETGPTQYHDFVAAGTYNVTLTVTDNAGNRASTTRIVTVNP